MNELQTEFDAVRASDSQQIYKALTAGKIISKYFYDDLKAEIKQSPLFTVIFNHLGHFKKLYQHIGFELVFDPDGDFFYVRDYDEGETEEADENAFRVQVALLIIGRFYSRSGRDLEGLTRPDMGLDETDFHILSDTEEYIDILQASRLPTDWIKVMDFLLERSFAHRLGEQRYILNPAALSFLSRLITNYNQQVEIREA